MSSDKGWFESDEDYRDRVEREANERTIEDSTGSAPSKGWLESDDDYRERITREANEHIIEDSTGSAPSKGWLESDDDYRDRLSREANERVVEDSTGSSPSKGWLENDDDYEVRVRKEANEQTIERQSGSAPHKGWLEGDHEYRSRVAHEARELLARERPSDEETSESTAGSTESTSWVPSGQATSIAPSSSSGIGCLVAAVVIVILGVSIANTGRQTTTAKNASKQDRFNESHRLAERARAEKVFPGEWRLEDRTEDGLATVTLLREGNAFRGEYRKGGRREPLSGAIEADNRLRLENDRQFCKIANPLTWYEGSFSQQAWIRMSTNDSVLMVSFSENGMPMMMTRIGE